MKLYFHEFSFGINHFGSNRIKIDEKGKDVYTWSRRKKFQNGDQLWNY